MNKNKLITVKKWDIIVIIILIVICLAIWLSSSGLSKSANIVEVYINNELFGEYDLSADNSFDIRTDKGNNTICIMNGEVYMKDADCSDKLCVYQRHIRYDGESIVCLPHNLIISVKSESEGVYDAITQ